MSLKCRISLVALAIFLLATTNAFADDLRDGQRLYAAGDFEGAAECFEHAIDNNDEDAVAHYYLANCQAAKKDYDLALAEYQRASEYSKDRKLREYCRVAMDKIRAFKAIKQAPATSTQQNVVRPSGTVGAEEKELRVRAILEKSRNEAKSILERADEECKPIQAEKKSVIQTMNIKYRGRIETTTAEERTETSNEYDQKIQSIKQTATAQANGILEQGRRDASSVGQGLPNLEELLGKNTDAAKLK